MSIAIGDEPPLLWRCDADFLGADEVAENKSAIDLLRHGMDDRSIEFWAHNAQFEIAVTRYRMQKDLLVPTTPHLSQWLCTAALARRAALPASLEKLAETLGLPQQKDKRGSALIRKFSIPNPKTGEVVSPFDDPEGFTQFGEYCRQDVRTEREIHKKLASFIPTGAIRETWELDKKVNDRGVPVNVGALKNAQKIIDVVRAEYTEEFREIVGLNPTQRDKVLAWFKSFGYPYDNMQATTVKNALSLGTWADTPEAYRALQLKSYLSYAAVTKVSTMLSCECGDGIVRGTLVYHGAGPGRWSGRLIQTQNLKRPDISDTDVAYSMICEGASAEGLAMCFGNPLSAVASCIRHFIQHPTDLLNDADYSAIEARIVCWLAGQEDALQEYRDGVDAYVSMASVIFNKPREKITAMERWVGKQTVLGCGFQMSSARFYDQCIELTEKFNIKGISVSPELADLAVGTFRRIRSKVVNLWYDCDRAAREAILSPGKVFSAGEKINFQVVTKEEVPYLAMRLPAGRCIVYPWPKLENKAGGKTNITFFGQLPGKSAWGRVSTYGGKLVENATQGTAADIMANGAVNAEKAGFEILTLIHDQALARHDGRPIEEFCNCLTDLPEWAKGLPIDAEGQITPYYVKG